MIPKKALVVDDSRSARYSLRKTLERLHISVDCVESGETALSYLEAAEEALPDIIFMDNLMPGMNGFSASEAIHEQKRWQHIPIVMCTAMQGTADFTESQDTPSTIGLLPKPATIGQIQALLADLSNTSVPQLKTPAQQTERHHPDSTQRISLIDGSRASLPSKAHAHTTTTHPAFFSATPTATNASTSAAQHKSPQAHSESVNKKAESQREPLFPTHSRTAAEASLESLIDRVQAQLKGIEPRLMSLESAKQTLDRAIQQRLNDMHDQLIHYIRSLIKETVDLDEHPHLEAMQEQFERHLTTQAHDIIEASVKTQTEAISEKLHEELNAQTRYMEHRLLGEAVNTEQIIEQATDAARLAVESHMQTLEDRPQGIPNLDDDDSPLRQQLLEAAELVAAEQAEKSVSDNLVRLQQQLAHSTQAQVNSVLKKQKLISATGWLIALAALAISVMT